MAITNTPPSNGPANALFQQALTLHTSGNLAEAERIYRALLTQESRQPAIISLLGTVYAQRGQFEEAIALYRTSLQMDPRQPEALCNCASALKALNRFEEALICYNLAIGQQPNYVEALSNRATTLQQLGRFGDALATLDIVIALQPNNAEDHAHRGILLTAMDRHKEALASYDRAIALNPQFAGAINNRGSILRTLGRYAEALESYGKAIAIYPDYADAHSNRGTVLKELGRYQEALTSYGRAIALKPDDSEVLGNYGAVLRALKHFEQALEQIDRAVSLAPADARILSNRGNVLSDLKRHHEALADFDRAIALAPDYAQAHMNRAVTLQGLKRYAESLSSFDRAIALSPDLKEAYLNRGNLLGETLRYDEAIPDYLKLLRRDPDYKYARGQLLHMRMHCCDWTDFAAQAEAIEQGVKDGKRICSPFYLQAVSHSPKTLRTCSEIFATDVYPPDPNPLWAGEIYRHDKIRVGYVSGEFREQATAYLAAGLFECHDRNRFELYAFDNGFDDGGPMRKRLSAAFGTIVDISKRPDRSAARLVRECEIDILVDLNGFFGLERGGVFAARAAPIQINYLGVPATLGAHYMDYIIADKTVIPEQEQEYYREHVVYLPNTYQVNDSKRRIADHVLTRAEAGLPDSGFVFCSFNNSYKYTPSIFDIWMRLLRNVEGSVLWILESNKAIVHNLRREAQERGVAADRLIFAPYAKAADHLARQKLADLFLDSLPCNAHTTASDALWAGLPIVTCMGSTFAARVAGSLLKAIGLPELITRNLEDYETLAFELATSPERLAATRRKLARNRTICPLFDTDRYRRHLESAYITMYERYRRGEPPAGFTVAASDS